MYLDPILIEVENILNSVLSLRKHLIYPELSKTHMVPSKKKKERFYLTREILLFLAQSKSRGFKPKEIFIYLSHKNPQLSHISFRSTLSRLSISKRVKHVNRLYFSASE